MNEAEEPLYKVRMSETLFQALGSYRVEWGEPDAEGFYTPTVTEAPRQEWCPICGVWVGHVVPHGSAT
jgi:hypothetical protein